MILVYLSHNVSYNAVAAGARGVNSVNADRAAASLGSALWYCLVGWPMLRRIREIQVDRVAHKHYIRQNHKTLQNSLNRASYIADIAASFTTYYVAMTRADQRLIVN